MRESWKIKSFSKFGELQCVSYNCNEMESLIRR